VEAVYSPIFSAKGQRCQRERFFGCLFEWMANQKTLTVMRDKIIWYQDKPQNLVHYNALVFPLPG
jgi:hypothetical protein